MIRVVHGPNFRFTSLNGRIRFSHLLAGFEKSSIFLSNFVIQIILLHPIFFLSSKNPNFYQQIMHFRRSLNFWMHFKRSNCSFAKEKIDSKSKLSFLLKLKINLYLKCNLSLTKRHFQNNVKSCELKH